MVYVSRNRIEIREARTLAAGDIGAEVDAEPTEGQIAHCR